MLTNSTPANRIQVNDMSCALLCVGLLPLMIKTSDATPSASPRPRITVVSSQTHLYTKPSSEELSSPNYLLKINDAEHCARSGVLEARYPLSKRTCNTLSSYFPKYL